MSDIQAHLPDGTILSFPAGTADAVIDSTVQSHIGNAAQDAPARVGILGMPAGGSFRPNHDYQPDPHGGANIIAGNELDNAVKPSPLEKIGHRALDPLRGMAQLENRAYGALTGDQGPTEAFNKSINRDEQTYQDRRAASGETGFDAWGAVGNTLGMLPIAAGLPAASGPITGALYGAASGALGGATAPVYGSNADFWAEKAKQTGTGALGGAAIGGATGALAKFVQPHITPEASELRKSGVDLTVGQTLGGEARKFESGMESIPFLGSSIRAAKERGITSFNQGAINMALAPIGEKLPASVTGPQAVSYMGAKIGDAYDRVLPSLTANVDMNLARSLGSAAMTVRTTPADIQTTFQKILRDDLATAVDPATGTISGDAFKLAHSQLGKAQARYSGSTDGHQQVLGDALGQVKDALLDAARRASPPEAVQALKQADGAYAMSIRVLGAADKAGTASRGGMFSPAQLDAAVRQLDPSLHGRAYGEGRALMQPYAQAGVRAIGNEVPDSGTPYRLAVSETAMNPLKWLLAGLYKGAGAAAYNAPTQRALTGLLAGGAPVREPFAELLNAGAPALAGGGGLLGGQMLLPLIP